MIRGAAAVKSNHRKQINFPLHSGITHRGFNVASIRVLAFAVENFFVKVDVVVVNGVIEGDGDHHGDVLCWQVTGNGGSVFRAEAVGQNAHRWVAWRSAVGIRFGV